VAQALGGLRCKLMVIGPLNNSQVACLKTNEIDFQNLVNLDRPTLIECYRKCDIVMFASTFEGFGMPILEGNAVGRPVITGNITSMPEVAADAACLVDPYSVQQIRDAVLAIKDDEVYRDDLITKGFANLVRFDPNLIAQLYLNVYGRVLNEQ
jgi:glycosyltransferase involved in cell wall biosynthesis